MVSIHIIQSIILTLLSISSLFSNYFTPSEIPWYDFRNHYQVISTDATSTIDRMLMNKNHSQLGLTSLQMGNRLIPGLGHHHYYSEHSENRSRLSTWTRYITLIKKEEESKGSHKQTQNLNYYVLIFSPFNQDISEKFKQELFSTDHNYIKAIHIDTSGYEVRETLVSRSCGHPQYHQKEAIQEIVNHWTDPGNIYFNTKIILSGPSGVGKSYTGELLKKYLENKDINTHLNTFVQLFIDFNPSTPGLDIDTVVLSKASRESPVIIIMNEIDQIYDQVFQTSTRYESRTSHTDSKVSFNNMLDAISRTPYVITVFTTERSPEYFLNFNGSNSSYDYRPFFRQGRVDFFIRMTSSGSNRQETILLK